MVMGLCVFLVHEMGVVCTDELYAVTSCQGYEVWLHPALLFVGFAVGEDCRVRYLMALELDIEIVAPNAFEPFHTMCRSFKVSVEDMLWNLTAETCRGDDEPFVVTLQVGKVGAGVHVEPVDPRPADQAYEVVIAHHVLCKYYQVPSTHVGALFLQHFVATACHIHFAAEDGFERFLPLLLTALVELLTAVEKLLDAKHIAMVGNRHPFHPVLCGFLYQLIYWALAVEE